MSLSLALLIFACSSGKNEQQTAGNESKPTSKPVSKYPAHVGDIEFDKALDDSSFLTCDSYIPQYYALSDDLRVDNDVFVSHFESVSIEKNTPLTYHTIRFVVNCKGKIGRLRKETMTSDYQAAQLDSVLTERIEVQLRAFDQWPTGRDFYQYLTFKIKGGKIEEIMP